jgi:hypothetical protein
MLQVLDDCQKPRLTEHVDILTAVKILRARGYQDDALITEITRIFYVDLDAYNEVIQMTSNTH